jgi:hypothetical protein
MAAKNIVDQMTALEVARRSSDPNAFTIIETMALSNTMLQELPAIEANDGAVHTHLQRRSYPGGEHRIYNQGIGKKSSQTETIHDWITMLEAFSDVDVAQARHSGNAHALYNAEASAFMVGMGGDQADDLVYGNHTQNPAEIDGLATRLPKIGEHCIDFGGKDSGRLTSAFIDAAGPNACHLIYPRGSKSVGVERRDAGEIYVEDPNPKNQGKQYLAHRDHFKAEYGIAIAHPDAVIRIANIPANPTPAQRVELLEIILRYQKRLTKGIVNTALFVNQDLIYQLERAGREAQYVVYPETDFWGKPITSINGLRFREQDAILSTEELVA